MSVTIEAYDAGMAGEAVALWNRALGARFPMTERLWRQNVDAEPNYRAGDGLVARDPDGALAGLVLTRLFRRLDANPDLARWRGLGWVVALVVAPERQGQGLGGRLLALAEERLRQEGATRCDLGGSIAHFLPGVPADDSRDRRALRFWERHGYRPDQQVHDLRRGLRDWAPPPPPPAVRDGDYRIGPARAGQEDAILAFLGREFPGRWRYEVAQAFARSVPAGDVIVLEDRSGAVEGFLVSWHVASPLLGTGIYWYPALGSCYGGCGPLGIAASLRGRGLGLALVAAGVSALHRRGVEECVIDWTTLVDFYGRLGFQVSTSYWRYGEKPLRSWERESVGQRLG